MKITFEGVDWKYVVDAETLSATFIIDSESIQVPLEADSHELSVLLYIGQVFELAVAEYRLITTEDS